MQWQVILAVILVIPIILFPAAFVWYLNINGLYQVIRDARKRQKRTIETLKEAKTVLRDISVTGTWVVAERIKTEIEMDCFRMGGSIGI